MLSQQFDSGPAPVAPVAISFDTPPPVHTDRFAVPQKAGPVPVLAAEPEFVPVPVLTTEPEFVPEPVRVVENPIPNDNPIPNVRETGHETAQAAGRLLAWSVDACLLLSLLVLCIAGTLSLAHVRYPLDFLRATAPAWLALLAVFAFAYSFFAGVAARSPGMALAGMHLESKSGGTPGLNEAFARAVLAPVSAALGLFGFLLALTGGQTLHDKLARCIVVID